MKTIDFAYGLGTRVWAVVHAVVSAIEARLHDVLWNRQQMPALELGELVMCEGVAIFFQTQFGIRKGPRVLTNRRIIWYEDAVGKLLKPIYSELRLSEITKVDKGTRIDPILVGHRRLRLHLRDGRHRCVTVSRGLNQWVSAIRQVLEFNASGA